MSNKIIQLNEGAIKQELKELIRNSVDWKALSYSSAIRTWAC